MDDHRATEEDGAASLRGIVTPSVSAVGAGSAGEIVCLQSSMCMETSRFSAEYKMLTQLPLLYTFLSFLIGGVSLLARSTWIDCSC